MAVIDISSGALSVTASTAGGVLLGFWLEEDGARVPLLRPAVPEDGALGSSCYPLVPFGNRVRDNRFTFEGREHVLTPNTAWDPLYLHGEGWQAEWSVADRGPAHIAMRFSHAGGNTPYAYEARQELALEDGALRMTLSVENRGDMRLPFGLGWHPFFPMTPETTLHAPAARLWTEAEGFLPGEPILPPAELDFSTPSSLPERWVNNGLEGWSGEAVIAWPERATKLVISADPLFKHAFLFVSDAAFDPSYRRDYFCFEPMSHLANGHNLPDLGGLVPLDPGQRLTGSILLRPEEL